MWFACGAAQFDMKKGVQIFYHIVSTLDIIDTADENKAKLSRRIHQLLANMEHLYTKDLAFTIVWRHC